MGKSITSTPAVIDIKRKFSCVDFTDGMRLHNERARGLNQLWTKPFRCTIKEHAAQMRFAAGIDCALIPWIYLLAKKISYKPFLVISSSRRRIGYFPHGEGFFPYRERTMKLGGVLSNFRLYS